MNSDIKRTPAFVDEDKMTFGKYKGEPLEDIPASYLMWLRDILHNEGYSTNPKPEIFEKMAKWQKEKVMLYNYIFNIQDALQMELGERE